jgi:succinylglutamic semialdehyde dehydrogenase
MQPLKHNGPTHFINGQWCDGSGDELAWTNPATGETTWRGRAASEREVNRAVEAAGTGFEHWCAASFDQRVEYAETFRNALQEQSEPLARTISADTGKPLWESRLEIQAMQAKVRLSIHA